MRDLKWGIQSLRKTDTDSESLIYIFRNVLMFYSIRQNLNAIEII